MKLQGQTTLPTSCSAQESPAGLSTVWGTEMDVVVPPLPAQPEPWAQLKGVKQPKWPSAVLGVPAAARSVNSRLILNMGRGEGVNPRNSLLSAWV